MHFNEVNKIEHGDIVYFKNDTLKYKFVRWGFCKWRKNSDTNSCKNYCLGYMNVICEVNNLTSQFCIGLGGEYTTEVKIINKSYPFILNIDDELFKI